MVTAHEVRAKYERWLLTLGGVVGVTSTDDKIIVLVMSQRDAVKIPRELDGFPVEVRVVGEVRFLP
ncbi:MAG: hypothetical protein DRN06_06735 [Thermoprotei archaeon]|nr:MAG: hypothetical protein DRN06_06735 [Thermoprotei archaeon]